MATKKEPDLAWIHRQAGLTIQFEYQDKGKPAQLNYTTVLGKLKDSDTWIVECDLTVTDGVANGEYWWPETAYVAVYKHDGEPASRDVTDEELSQFGVDDE